jgi:hypothetical protein
LPGITDDTPRLLLVLDDVATAHPDAPVCGAQRGGQHAHQGGLAGAVGAQQTKNLSWQHRQGDTLERLDLCAASSAERLAQGVGLDRILGFHFASLGLGMPHPYAGLCLNPAIGHNAADANVRIGKSLVFQSYSPS